MLGYLNRSRRLLEALLVLDDAGMADAGEGLARAVLENAATAGWLLADPGENVPRLFNAFKRDWRQLFDQGLASREELTPEEVKWIEEGPVSDLPSMRKRARTTGLDKQYAIYKPLSMKLHGTAVTAASGLQPELPGIREAYLTVATGSLAKLTQLVGDRFDWGKTGNLVKAMTEVNDLVESPFPGRNLS